MSDDENPMERFALCIHDDLASRCPKCAAAKAEQPPIEPPPDVVPLLTIEMRERQADAAYQTRAMAEAITMLEEALAYARGRAVGERVTGVVVAFSFEDRAYGRHIPVHADNYGPLIAAVADAQYGLMKLTNGD